MIDNTKYVDVINLVGHHVGYKIEDGSGYIRRVFEPYETQKVEVQELRKLSYQQGGKYILQELLCVNNRELAAEFGVPHDMVEYFWTKEDVDAALTTEPIEVLLDALEFGPEGIKDMIVTRAVELEISDMNRRKAIYDMTDLNIDKRIQLKQLAGVETQKEESKRQRRVTSAGTSSGRRAQI